MKRKPQVWIKNEDTGRHERRLPTMTPPHIGRANAAIDAARDARIRQSKRAEKQPSATAAPSRPSRTPRRTARKLARKRLEAHRAQVRERIAEYERAAA